ncbi:EndoU domain-containing protein [Psychrobacter alimentarius]|uniref:EndoU domain-containing protein n=1 Tax=Psychrobacter alimentarius TaxID=261164 RepID=UPI00191B4BD2|nr:EndoU domain-containing protein [Psychrobacter alimentarius]
MSNRQDVIKTTAHELDHVRGGSSEYLADLAGVAADLNVSASMDANQDKINSYKPDLGDGRDADTQIENEQLIGQNDEKLIIALDKDPESFDYATSYKQDFQYLGRFVDNDTAKAYMAIDKSQEQAYFKGSQAAFNEFGRSIVDAPANIKALYEATKDDPVVVAVEVGKALKNLPEEYYDMGKDITYASLLGNKDKDFYNAGKASTAIALDAVSSIISAGGAVVVKKTAGKVTGIEFKFPRRKPNRSDTNGTGTGKNANNKPNSQQAAPDYNRSYGVPDEDKSFTSAANRAERDVAAITNTKDWGAQQKIQDNEQIVRDTEQKEKQAAFEANMQSMSDSSKAKGDELKAEQKALEARSEAERRAANERLGIPDTSFRTIVSPELESKILYGQRTKNSKGNTTNRLVGAHSGKISNDHDSFAVETISINADGTRNAKLITQFEDGNVSKIKTSTLFPEKWTDNEIISAVKKTGDSTALATRASDGTSLFQSTVNGVKVEVIKIGDNVTAGYPCGRGCTSPASFGGK